MTFSAYTYHATYFVHNNAKGKQQKKKNFRRDGTNTTDATAITDDTQCTQIPESPYLERIIIVLKLTNSGRYSYSLTLSALSKDFLTPYIRKKRSKALQENAGINRIAKKKGKKIQAQIFNISGLHLLNSALPS